MNSRHEWAGEDVFMTRPIHVRAEDLLSLERLPVSNATSPGHGRRRGRWEASGRSGGVDGHAPLHTTVTTPPRPSSSSVPDRLPAAAEQSKRRSWPILRRQGPGSRSALKISAARLFLGWAQRQRLPLSGMSLMTWPIHPLPFRPPLEIYNSTAPNLWVPSL